jgi:hypothetical protein
VGDEQEDFPVVRRQRGKRAFDAPLEFTGCREIER